MHEASSVLSAELGSHRRIPVDCIVGGLCVGYALAGLCVVVPLIWFLQHAPRSELGYGLYGGDAGAEFAAPSCYCARPSFAASTQCHQEAERVEVRVRRGRRARTACHTGAPPVRCARSCSMSATFQRSAAHDQFRQG